MNYIVYNKRDLDGKCSGAIAVRWHEEENVPYELVPYDYGDAFPWSKITKDDTVYMLRCTTSCVHSPSTEVSIKYPYTPTSQTGTHPLSLVHSVVEGIKAQQDSERKSCHFSSRRKRLTVHYL